MSYEKIINEEIKELELTRQNLIHKLIDDMDYEKINYDLSGNGWNAYLERTSESINRIGVQLEVLYYIKKKFDEARA